MVHRQSAALGDPTRLALVEQLARRPTSAATSPFRQRCRCPPCKHVRVLEQAGLLTTVKRGRVRECRVRECRLREDALVAVATWTTSMTATDPTPGARVRPVAPLLHAGLPAVLPAGVATTALAAAGRAAGISLDMAGEPIPVLGSSVPTVAFGLVGVLLAVARRLP